MPYPDGSPPRARHWTRRSFPENPPNGYLGDRSWGLCWPHLSVRSNHFSDNYVVVRSPPISQKILYYLDRTFARAQLQKYLPVVSFFVERAPTNLGTFLKAWITFFFVSKVVSGEDMKEKFWKKFHVFLSLRSIDRIIKRWISWPWRPSIACFIIWTVSKSRFLSKKPRSWRRVWTKNSEKNLRSPS